MRRGLVAVVALSACARGPAASFPSPTPGTATIALATELAWPLVADAPMVDVDGEVERGATIVRRLDEGNHYAMFRVDVLEPCGVAGSSRHRRVRVQGSETFRIGPRGGTIGFVVSAGASTAAPLEERLRTRVVRLGDVLAATANDVEPVPAKCLALDTPHAAECRVEARVAHARAIRDVVRLNCQAQKLDAIRKELSIVDAPADAQDAPDEARREAARTHVKQLLRESDECVGEEVAFVGDRQITVVEDTCGPELAEPPPTGEVQGAPIVVPVPPMMR